MTTLEKPRLGDIIVLESELDTAEFIAFVLEKNRYKARIFAAATQDFYAAIKELPSLVVIDIASSLDALDVLKDMRTSDTSVQEIPVLVLASSSHKDRIVEGLELGAADYLTKPLSANDLLTCVKAIFERSSLRLRNQIKPTVPVLVAGPLVLNLEKMDVAIDGELGLFTKSEWIVLYTLLSMPGRVFTRTELLAKVSGGHRDVTDRIIDVHLRAIRKKLGRHSELIQTVRGIGYRFSLTPKAQSSKK